MKVPQKANKYCPYCKKATEHKLSEVKKRKANENKQGQRRFRRVTAGYRGFPRPKPSNKKPTKKRDLRLKCSVCGKSHVKSFPRVKKFEWEK